MAAPGGTERQRLIADPSHPAIAPLLARCTWPEGPARVTGDDRVDLAVSGGADSTALLVLALAAGLNPVVHHVDHALRATSAADADAVVDLATDLGVSAVVHRVAVPEGPNLEERCRRARLAVLPEGCLTGHTADDQAETVLLRLMRGTGPAGLAAMSTDRHPLLGLRRVETRELCRALGIDVVEDPTNTDPRFTRNRVRLEVLPLLRDVAGRDVVPLLCRLAELSADQAEVLEDLVAEVEPRDAAEVAALPPALAGVVLRRWWTEETDGSPPPDAAAVERMRAVAGGEARRCDVVGGWSLERSANRLTLRPPSPNSDRRRAW